jgi:uncharacterized protein (DUF3084 family)
MQRNTWMVILAVIVVAVVAVAAVVNTNATSDRINAVERQAKTTETQVSVVEEKVEKLDQQVKQIDQKLDQQAKNIDKLDRKAEKVGEEAIEVRYAHLAPAPVSAQTIITAMDTLKSQGASASWSSIELVLAQIKASWSSLSLSDQNVVGAAFFDTFSATSVLNGVGDERADQVWDIPRMVGMP